MRSYTSMELDDEDKIDMAIPALGQPDYPYGLRLSFTERELVKLGVGPDDTAEVGDLFHFAAFAKVTSVSAHDAGDGMQRRVELQITMISCMENESTEFGDDDDA